MYLLRIEIIMFFVIIFGVLGTVLKTFERHPHEKNTVIFNSGDLTFLDFDKSAYALVTKSPLYSKAVRSFFLYLLPVFMSPSGGGGGTWYQPCSYVCVEH